MKRCQVYAMFTSEQHIGNSEFSHAILKLFEDIFLDEIPRLSPRRDIDFTINLETRESLVSRAPY